MEIKRNNPGNIRPAAKGKWQGEITRPGQPFCEFSSLEFGCRAMLKLLRNYMTLHGLTTIRKIIYRWAPPEDRNHTENYIKAVCQYTKFSPRDEYEPSKEFLVPLAKAMTRVEHAQKSPSDATWEAAWTLLN